MKMAASFISLMESVGVLCAVIAAASTGNWPSCVVILVALMPLALIARWFAESLGLIGN